MNSPGTDLASATSAADAAILTAYVDSIRPSLYMLALQTAFTAMLIPLLCILLFGSQPDRKAIYYMNILGILLCLVTGSMGVALQLGIIMNPSTTGTGPMLLATAIFSGLTPMYIDLMLLMRLCLVYRAEWTRWVRVCVYSPAVLLLVGRLANITNTMIHIVPLVLSQDVLKGVEVIVWHDAGAQAEFFMQILNNAYISLFFLYRIRKAISRAGSFGQSSYVLRLRILFSAATSSFVIPVMLNIAQLIFIYTNLNALTAAYISTLFVLNATVQIVCALLATVWRTTYEWSSIASESSSDCNASSSPFSAAAKPMEATAPMIS